MSPTAKPQTTVWRNPLTYQEHRDVPLPLAARLDAIAAAARPRADQPHTIAHSQARQAARDQLQYLLSAFANRGAYRRLVDEIHAGDDGLLPISQDRLDELRQRAATFAGLRDIDVVWALREGASIEDAALAAGISVDDAAAALSHYEAETEDSDA